MLYHNPRAAKVAGETGGQRAAFCGFGGLFEGASMGMSRTFRLVRGRIAGIALAACAMALGMALSPASAPAQQGNAEEGAEIFKKCRACHDVGPTAKNKLGPLLNGVIGRKAGTIEGFKYSPANLEAGAKGLVWTEEKLFKYLQDPRAFMPGTIMAFAGLRDEQDRRDLIAYLKKFNDNK
jgi:cytochrome c